MSPLEEKPCNEQCQKIINEKETEKCCYLQDNKCLIGEKKK